MCTMLACLLVLLVEATLVCLSSSFISITSLQYPYLLLFSHYHHHHYNYHHHRNSNKRIQSQSTPTNYDNDQNSSSLKTRFNNNYNHNNDDKMTKKKKTKTRNKLDWLLRTTSQIIVLPEALLVKDNKDNNHNQNGESDVEKKHAIDYNNINDDNLVYPIGSLPYTYITKIPTLMNSWLKRINTTYQHSQYYYKQTHQDSTNQKNVNRSINSKSYFIDYNSAKIIEMLLQRLIDEENAGNNYFVSTSTTATDRNIIHADLYNIVIEAWMKSSTVTINTYLHSSHNNDWNDSVVIHKYNHNNNHHHHYGNNHYYHHTLTCANHVHSIFLSMISQEQQLLVGLQQQSPSESNRLPNMKTFVLVLKAWMRCKEYCSISKMEEIINQLEKQYNHNYNTTSIAADTTTASSDDINLFLHDYEYENDITEDVNNIEITTNNNADGIFYHQHHYHFTPNNYQYHILQTTILQCYNMYLYALANCKETMNQNNDYTLEKERAQKAHDILLKLKSKSSSKANRHIYTNYLTLNPDLNTYNQVLSAYAKTRSIQGASKAQSILDEMINDVTCKVGHNNNGGCENDDDNCLQLVYPDTNTFNAVMCCWHKSGSKNASFHIEYLLNLMNGLSRKSSDSEGVYGYRRAHPDLFSVNTAIASIGKSSRKEKLRRAHYILMNMESLYGVKPDTVSYNIVLDSYSKSRDVRAIAESERLLTSMERLYMDGNDLVMPDSFTYSIVIDTICSRVKKDLGHKAELIVKRMEKMWKEHDGDAPSTIVYNSLLNCYATSGDITDIHKLETTLRFMETMSQNGDLSIKPSRITYNTVLKGYMYAQVKDNFTKKAEELLERMETQEVDVEPDEISYTTIISTFARSSIPGKASRAKRILDKMIDAYLNRKNKSIRMTIYPFNACLNACAYTFNRNEKANAFVVAVDTLVLIQKFSKPDHTTYGTLLKCWRNLIPKHDERRQNIVSSSFRQCCKEGQVGQLVIKQLQLATSPEVYFELVRHPKDINISSLPPEWSRNVKERRDI